MNKLKELRKEKGYTQAEIAELLKIKQQQYSRYEKQTNGMSIETLKKICNIYHVSADYLLELTDEKKALN